MNDIDAFLEDPQAAASGTVFEVEHPAAGRMRQLASPLRFAETPTRLRRHAPRLGEHGDEVLGELGYAPEEVAELRREGLLI